jgi:hypothetical protein
MKTVIKILACFAAFFPGVMSLFLFGFNALYPISPLSVMMMGEPSSPMETFSKIFSVVGPAVLTAAAIVAVSTAIVVGFMIHVFRSPRVDDAKRWPWTIAMLFGAPLALPIYWHVHVWSAPGVGSAPMQLSRRANIALGAGAAATLLATGAILAWSASVMFGSVSTELGKTLLAASNVANLSPAQWQQEAQKMQRDMLDAAQSTTDDLPAIQVANFANGMLRAVLAAIIVMHAFRSARLEKGSRILWVLLLLLASRLVMPIYWYLHMWKENGEPGPAPAAVAPPAAEPRQ